MEGGGSWKFLSMVTAMFTPALQEAGHPVTPVKCPTELGNRRPLGKNYTAQTINVIVTCA